MNEDLIERVKAAVLVGVMEKTGGGFPDRLLEIIARAAIAEYEKEINLLEMHLGNLLARVHRDGGHYQDEHRTEKAVLDADKIIAGLFNVEAEAAAMREALENATSVLRTAMDTENIDERERMNMIAASIWRFESVLSSDAGKKVLAVVEAARGYLQLNDTLESSAIETTLGRNRIRDTLAALDGESGSRASGQ